MIAELVTIIGQDVTSKNPKATKKVQPIELITLSLLTSLIKNEINNKPLQNNQQALSIENQIIP